jgi:hypothetical protein
MITKVLCAYTVNFLRYEKYFRDHAVSGREMMRPACRAAVRQGLFALIVRFLAGRRGPGGASVAGGGAVGLA